MFFFFFLWSLNRAAAYDGWLTLGITEGNTGGELNSVGLDWDTWTVDAGLDSVDGAVFWMYPDDGPGGEVVVAQFTTSASWTATLGDQGRTSDGGDWQANSLEFSGGGGSGGGNSSGRTSQRAAD